MSASLLIVASPTCFKKLSVIKILWSSQALSTLGSAFNAFENSSEQKLS